MHASVRAGFCIVIATAIASSATAEDWPNGYVVAEQSKSPDAQFGILVPKEDAAISGDSGSRSADEGSTNYFADLPAHHAPGKIKDADYFERQNHRSLFVHWRSDSRLCVAEYWGRFGADAIIVLKPRANGFDQRNIVERVHNATDAAVKSELYIAPHFRFDGDGNIRVIATGMDNPKQFENVETHYALFRGTYDPRVHKWLSAAARRVDMELHDNYDAALQDEPEKTIFVGNKPPADFSGQLVQSDNEKAQLLDDELNHVYQTLSSTLSAAQFAQVKDDEKSWLQQLNAASSAEAKCRLLAARIKNLQDLLWR